MVDTKCNSFYKLQRPALLLPLGIKRHQGPFGKHVDIALHRWTMSGASVLHLHFSLRNAGYKL